MWHIEPTSRQQSLAPLPTRLYSWQRAALLAFGLPGEVASFQQDGVQGPWRRLSFGPAYFVLSPSVPPDFIGALPRRSAFSFLFCPAFTFRFAAPAHSSFILHFLFPSPVWLSARTVHPIQVATDHSGILLRCLCRHYRRGDWIAVFSMHGGLMPSPATTSLHSLPYCIILARALLALRRRHYSLQSEVFSLNNLFAASLLLCHSHLRATGDVSWAEAGAFLSGLGMTNQHTLALFVAPLALHAMWTHRKQLLTVRGCLR